MDREGQTKMKKNRDELLAKIEESIKELPEKAQEAICWLIIHLDEVQEICKDCTMTENEIKKHKEYAKIKENYIVLALLCAVQTYSNNKPSEQQNQTPGSGITE